MDEESRGQGGPLAIADEVALRGLTELVVDEWEEAVGGEFIAGGGGVEQEGGVFVGWGRVFHGGMVTGESGTRRA